MSDSSDILKTTVVKLHCEIETIDSCSINSALNIIKNSVLRTCWVNIVNRKATFADLPKTKWVVRFKNILSLGNESDVKKCTDITDISQILSLYKRKNKILIIKLEKLYYLISDKNNYKLVTSLLNDNDNLTSIDRTFKLPCSEHQCDKHASDIFKKENQDVSSQRGFTDQGRKVLKPRTTRRTKRAPTAVKPEQNKQGYIYITPAIALYHVYPFDSEQFKNPKYAEGSYKTSIQETDGARSLSYSCFVSNVGCRYSPTTSTSELQSARRENIIARNVPLARYPDKKDYEIRLQTFMDSDWDNYPNRPHLTILVDWGFFFTGRFDLVRCFQCGIGLKDWTQEDVVVDEHIKHSPDCAFLKEKLGQENLNQLKLSILYQTEGEAGYVSADRTSNYVATSITDSAGFLRPNVATNSQTPIKTQDKSTGKNYVNKNDVPKLPYPLRHPEYQTMESRRATFNTFPRTVQQNPRKLALAGFVYTGNEDICRCFCCDGGMRNWEPEDDPIIEHAKHFPTCNYIRQIKGDDFIRKVRIDAGMEKEKVPPPQYNGHCDHSPVAASEGHELAQNNYSRTGASNNERKPDKSTIVKNVLQTGFEKFKVEKAVDILIERGILDFIEDDIVNIILDLPDADDTLENGDTEKNSNPESMLQENERLKSVLNCIICIKEEANVLFLPCAHHKVCIKCSENMKTCPVCSREVTKRVKTYMS